MILCFLVMSSVCQIFITPNAGFGNQLRAINGLDYLAVWAKTNAYLTSWKFAKFFSLSLATGSNSSGSVLKFSNTGAPKNICHVMLHNEHKIIFAGHVAPLFHECMNTSRYDQTQHLNTWLKPNESFAKTIERSDYAIHARTCVDCGKVWTESLWLDNIACIRRTLRCQNDTSFIKRKVFVATDSQQAKERLTIELMDCGHEVITNSPVCASEKFIHSDRDSSFNGQLCVLYDWYSLAMSSHIIAGGTTFSLTASVFQPTSERREKGFTRLGHVSDKFDARQLCEPYVPVL
jgi:hypothetical protein